MRTTRPRRASLHRTERKGIAGQRPPGDVGTVAAAGLVHNQDGYVLPTRAAAHHHLDEGRTPVSQEAGVSAFPGARERVQRLLEALLASGRAPAAREWLGPKIHGLGTK
jgi:hypothetical protein